MHDWTDCSRGDCKECQREILAADEAGMSLTEAMRLAMEKKPCVVLYVDFKAKKLIERKVA